MKCINHSDVEAKYNCEICGDAICEQCGITVMGKNICKKCAEKEAGGGQNERKKTFESYGAFLFSFIPGAAHMYLGMMNQGIQIMVVFLGLLAMPFLLGQFIQIQIITIMAAIVVWSYSFFQSYHIRKALAKGERVEDKAFGGFEVKNINGRYVGIIILLIGLFSLLGNIDWLVVDILKMDNVMYNATRRLTLPVIMIFLGLRLMSINKLKLQTKMKESEEIQKKSIKDPDKAK